MTHFRPAITAAPIAFLLLLTGSADPPLAPGQWELRNTPGVARLDGRALKELPIGPIRSEMVCLSASEALSPARFLIRDLGEDCTVKNAKVARGRVRIAGTCPNQVEGPDASFQLSGRYDRNSYAVAFATVAVGENGRMTFSGKMTGRRVGACAGPKAD